jgi:hypothetical protein
MLEHHDQLLRVIQRYFTCEGRFNKVYMYHIRLLMHFTGKKALNLPYYLCRILGKMVDKVQAKSKQVEPSLFHFSLIKLLVLEELKKTNREWSYFLSTSGFCVETTSSPPSKGSTPSTSAKATSNSLKRKKGNDKEQPIVIETPETTTKTSLNKGSKKKGKEPLQGIKTVVNIEETPDSKRGKLKGKKLLFTPETTKMEKPRKPLTRSATKKLIPADETFPCHEVEDVVEFQPPPGKKVMFSPEVLDKERLGRPVTRSSTRRQDS